MRALIATVKKPNTPESFPVFCKMLRESAAEGQLTIPPGIWWTSGPGCYNLAFEVVGDEEEAERFVNAVVLYSMMPAKWSTTSDNLPEVDTCDLFR